MMVLFTCLFSTAAAAALLGTSNGCCKPEGWLEIEQYDAGVSTDLHAMVDTLDYHRLAVGSNGVVLVFDAGWNGIVAPTGGSEATVSTVPGGADLHGAMWEPIDEWDDTLLENRAHGWVVGDGGVVAITTDLGQTWSMVDVGTTNDLYAIASSNVITESNEYGPVVVVGDGTVRFQDIDGTWSEPPAPVGGWGQLRDIFAYGGRLWAVGLGGVMWTAEHPSEDWVAQDTSTSADLLVVTRCVDGDRGEGDRIQAFGAGGAALFHGPGTSDWTSYDTGLDADIIGCDGALFLTADGEVFEVDRHRGHARFTHVTTVPGARALDYGIEDAALVVVGDAGLVAGTAFVGCGDIY